MMDNRYQLERGEPIGFSFSDVKTLRKTNPHKGPLKMLKKNRSKSNKRQSH
jgi:hypothetical protein